MMGLVEEGQTVMEEGEKKEDAAADLALIGAAQRLEHYEISGYTTARNLAQQLRQRAIVALLPNPLRRRKRRSASRPGRSVAHVGRQDAGRD
jgi:Mn-containing catalase